MLTPELTAGIAAAVKLGMTLTAAAGRLGIGHASVSEWLARGEGRHERKPTPITVAFAEAIARARAEHEGRRLARLEVAAQGGAITYRRTVTSEAGKEVVEERYAPPDWRADAWVMERRDPASWGPVQRHQIEAGDGAPTVVVVAGVSLDKALGRKIVDPVSPDTPDVPQGVDVGKALGNAPKE
jgi:hypothetical protein